MIGDDIEIVITNVLSGQIHLGIKTPKDVQILRKEMLDRERPFETAAEPQVRRVRRSRETK